MTEATRFLFSKHRLEALTDGIFAVAMTLLVIELKLPEPATIAVPNDLLRGIAHQIPTFIAWTISFFVLGIFWTVQQRVFHFVRHVDEPLSWLVIAYLGLVSLMPFASALVGQYGTILFSQIINSAHMIALSVASLLITRYVCRHPELWLTEPPTAFYRAARFRTISLVFVALLAIGITAAAPGLGGMAFILMLPISRFSRRLERR